MATILFLWMIDLGLGFGGMERVAFYPLTLWCGIQGVWLLLVRQGRNDQSGYGMNPDHSDCTDERR